MGIYRPPNLNNLDTLFEEVTDSIRKAILTYENFIMGDFNIDINTAGMDVDKLDEFCNLFDLTNLIKTETCCTKNHKSTIDLFLTNRPLSFQKTRTTETGISDYHKIISSFFKSHYTRLKPKIIYYRNYKEFNEKLFLEDLEISNLSANSDNQHDNYTNLTQTFSKVVQKHAPLKKKILRGNHAPFINREFRKEIYKRSRLRNKFWKDPSKENELLFKTQRNKCVSLRRKSIKSYCQDVPKKGLITNKPFWNFVKPFLTNKSCHTQNDIMLIDNGKVVIVEEHDVAETFNDHYINIVEKLSGQKPCNFISDKDSLEDDMSLMK